MEEGKRCRFGKKSDIDLRDVANDVVLAVKNGKGGDAFVIHQLQGVCERSVAVDCKY